MLAYFRRRSIPQPKDLGPGLRTGTACISPQRSLLPGTGRRGDGVSRHPFHLGMTRPSSRCALSVLISSLLFVTVPYALAAPSTPHPEHVYFFTADGPRLEALFHAPAAGKPTVVCLHGLAAVKEEWSPFLAALEKAGWGYLAYDARGHGESSLTKDANGAPNGFQAFGPPGPGTPWQKMVDDVGAAIKFLSTEKKVNRETISLAGASLGANVVLTYAALTNRPRAVIALSPGLNYAEIKPEDTLSQLKEPHVLLVASPTDRYAFESSRTLVAQRPGTVFWSDVKPGHGAQMFDDALLARLIQWLAKNG